MSQRQSGTPRQQQAETFDTVPPSDWVAITLRVRPDLHEALKGIAEVTGKSRNALINEAIEHAMTPPGGVALIAKERRRLTPQGLNAEQAWAAIAFILAYLGHDADAERAWPWSGQFYPERGDHTTENLIRAGGLIAAEIDRFQDGVDPQ